MYIGSLVKVMGIHEDSKSAYKARIRNRAYRDPNTTVATKFKGSISDMNNQMKKMMPPKETKKFDKWLQNEKDKAVTNQMNIDEKNRVKEKDHDRKWYEQDYDKWLNNNTSMNAGYHNRTKIIGINSYLSDGAIDKKGQIDSNSRLMTHEKQHEIQDKIQTEYIKEKGKNHQNKLKLEADKQAAKLKNTMNKYTQDEIPNNLHYKSLPAEFDANVAAVRGYNSAGKGTIRTSLQTMGKWPGREIKPKIHHATSMYNASFEDGRQDSPSQRTALANRVSMQTPIRYQRDYLQAPNKPSTTPLPQKTQEFINKTSNKINNQIKNGRTFTNKDLENAQPLRQNPIPRKQR